MSSVTTISGSGSVGSCSSEQGAGNECYLTSANAGLGQTFTFEPSKSLKSEFFVKGDVDLVNGDELARDETDLTPIQVTPAPSGQKAQPRVSLGLTLYQFKAILGGAEVSDEAAYSPAEQRVKRGSLTYKLRGGPPLTGRFKGYLETGIISPKPEHPYKPDLKSPFAGVPVGHEVPSKFAVRGGIQEVPIGPFSVGVEAGQGWGGVVTGSTGYSILGSLGVRFSKKYNLAFAVEKTHEKAAAEPELDQFYEAKGETEVSPAFYGRLQLLGAVNLYGGQVPKRIRYDHFDDPESTVPDGQVERKRTMTYGAITFPLSFLGLKDTGFGVMHGVQEFTRDYVGTRGIPIEAEGRLTSVEANTALGWGFALAVNFFSQAADGEGIESYRNSGGFVTLNWSGSKDIPW